MNSLQLTQTLSESFNALADEVQSLIDRKTILEHKLRYAHEQYQYLADKYAPDVPGVSETLAKLQLPPDLHPPSAATTTVVPLPRRGQPGTEQHQLALLIREGRKAAQQLAAGMVDMSRASGSSKETSASPDSAVTMTTVSTALEKDFTVPGRKSHLACPFSPSVEVDDPAEAIIKRAEGGHDLAGTTADAASPHASDPICVAMLEEKTSAPPTAPSKCPIRFLDKHSPEEIAHYVETHKHEIPRSHEICVRRYQRNEEQIRKLDAKYGSLVGMINDLSQLHRPMLPSAAMAEHPEEVDTASNKRVESWARAISSGGDSEEPPQVPVDEDRQGRFDRPLRDVRLGESPSRPWGIPVPFGVSPAAADADGGVEPDQRPISPSPAPVRMHSPTHPLGDSVQEAGTPPKKCPFDHTKLSLRRPPTGTQEGRPDPEEAERPSAPVSLKVNPEPSRQQDPFMALPQPTFINMGELPFTTPNAEANATGTSQPQVVFNISGPVFIGYPMEQAIQFMQRLQGQ
ncbi:hypothetical protein QBC37DRAFT_280396 [Rhypophila decipiens]|uniref:Uncharacterized protein n=1 Tax=Rhypophila decipiens TaxID=261697 RepID=A0AAN6YAZ6_9PEZI|nr:hypothetical protein QBC37DRAFT_280396 [Rhypophila decipiens]